MSLTDRQLEVVRLVCGGMARKEIAAKLFISEGTLCRHLTDIYRRLGFNPQSGCRYLLLMWAVNNGIIKPSTGVDWSKPKLWPDDGVTVDCDALEAVKNS